MRRTAHPPQLLPFGLLGALGASVSLSACGGDGGGNSERRACDFSGSGAHTCSELLSGTPSIACEQRGGEQVAHCEEGWSTSCDAETRDGTYRFYGYDDVDQSTLDQRCEEQRRAIGMPPDNGLPQGECSWTVEGDEASGLGSQAGTCYLHAFASNELSFRDSALQRGVSITAFDFTFFASSAPVTLKPLEGGSGLLTEFQLSVLGPVKAAEAASNWYCSFINGRTQPRGTFSVRLERFSLASDGGLARYQGTVEAVCPAAGEPAAGSLTVRVKFSGMRE